MANFKKIPFILPFILFISFISSIKAQEITQILRGRVIEAVSKAPISDAAITINNTKFSTSANTEGVFQMEQIPVGRYRLTISSVGFQPLILTDILVESGKETVLEIVLNTSTTALDTFVYVAQSSDRSAINFPSVSLIEKLRFQYPATFADPARYASFAAGVTTDNDQANNLSIRGISPNAMQWYLQGAEIVNPNHLSNAGTLSDKASANGGGVMILSAQLLENTTLFQGAMPPQYGNALAGALDMRLRKGNDSRRQNTVQLSLIGLDAATEGYFNKEKKASYLINYRYATIGLLSKLGVPLGDEDINYQDLSFNLNFPTQKMGEFSIFGVGGMSENIFKAKKPGEWIADKDSQDISFKGRMGVLGLRHQVSLGKKMLWQSVFAASALDDSRDAIGYNRLEQPIRVETIDNTHAKYFFKTEINSKLGGKPEQSRAFTEGSIGLIVKEEVVSNNTISKIFSNTSARLADGNGIWLIPYAQLGGELSDKWHYKIGVRGVYFSFNEKFSLEPSAILNYQTSENSFVQLNYSRQSQLIQPALYFAKNSNRVYINRNLDFVKSDNIGLSFNKNFKNNIRINAEAFYQTYSNVYYNSDNSTSLLDDLNSLTAISNSLGTAQSIGLALNTSQNLSNGLFWQLNAALFDALWKDKNDVERNLTYNSRYTSNALLGKEWTRGSRRNKFFGISGRAVLRGGFWQKGAQVKDYFRTDLNVYFKRNRKNWQSTIQLDIQNVTNRENEWTTVFDRLQGRTIAKKQLGLIPNVAYKVEF